jgi:hypothetical protein
MTLRFLSWLRFFFAEQYAGSAHIAHRTIGSEPEDMD